jgi:hypothetical protein
MVFNVTEQLQDLEEQWATCEQVPVANPDLVQQQLAKSKVIVSVIQVISESGDKRSACRVPILFQFS